MERTCPRCICVDDRGGCYCPNCGLRLVQGSADGVTFCSDQKTPLTARDRMMIGSIIATVVGVYGLIVFGAVLHQ